MIVHHRTGEFVSAAMSRQYRPAFNISVPVAGFVAGGLLDWLVWSPLFFVPTGAAVLFTYLVNLKGRRNRIHPYALKRPTRLTEDWVLELQDIYFRMPPAHRDAVSQLLDGAYAQIELGNIDAVNPRLEKAKALKGQILAHHAQLDTQDDIRAVDQHVRAMKRAIEA